MRLWHGWVYYWNSFGKVPKKYNMHCRNFNILFLMTCAILAWKRFFLTFGNKMKAPPRQNVNLSRGNKRLINFSNIPTHTTTSSRGWSIYTAEIILIFSCLRKIFTFTRRRYFHFVANRQEKIGVVSIPKISLQPICKPKWRIFQIMFKDSLKGILHVVKKDQKLLFWNKTSQTMQKFNKFRFFCMS